MIRLKKVKIHKKQYDSQRHHKHKKIKIFEKNKKKCDSLSRIF